MDAVNDRLRGLKEEYARGRQQLELLERQREEVRDTLLRISGAIQVLEEILGQNSTQSAADEHAVAAHANGQAPVVPITNEQLP